MPTARRLSVGLDELGTRLRRWNGAVQTVHQLLGKHGHTRCSVENAPNNAGPHRQHPAEAAAVFPSVLCPRLAGGCASNRYPEGIDVARHLHAKPGGPGEEWWPDP